MTPLKLTLKGFAGISAGLGRDELTLDLATLTDGAQLVALVGPNGTGKTSVLDNLTPYRLLPSRASSYSPNAFSFYDHLSAGEASKELIWSYGGRVYRTSFVFKVARKTRKMEAYLAVQNGDDWQPVTLPDGTIADGKTASYDTCVEHILGSPALFFTAAFSAQNRPALSSYTQGDIKGLLSELLGLEEAAARAKESAEVARRLKALKEPLLTALRQADELATKSAQVETDLETARATIPDAEAVRVAAREETRKASRYLADVEAEQRGNTEVEERREWTRRQIADVERESERESGQARMTGRDRSAEALTEAERARLEAARIGDQIAERRRRLESAEALSKRGPEIDAAEAARPGLEDALTAAVRDQEAAQERADLLSQVATELRTTESHLSTIAREGETEARNCTLLIARSALIDEVPCQGTDLQGRCKLLSEAVEAKAKIPAVQGSADARRQEYRDVKQHLQALKDRASELADTPQRLEQAKQAAAAARGALDDNARVCSLRSSVEQAASTAEQATADIVDLTTHRDDAVERETAQRTASEKALAEAADQVRVIEARYADKRDELQRALAELPPPADVGTLDAARNRVADADRAMHDAETRYSQAVSAVARLESDLESLVAQIEALRPARTKADRLDDEIAHWTLLAQGLGNNGVIALSIDDAGPTLASIANDLLNSCYGPRFSVRIDTQTETAKGEAKEAFDLVVFDAERDSEKSIRQMSGGERIWINEALTRAIALYQAQQSGRQYECLFADESDGALDPERKTHFMRMKRKVLEIGGYTSELFISHTPELWEMADSQINLGDYRL